MKVQKERKKQAKAAQQHLTANYCLWKQNQNFKDIIMVGVTWISVGDLIPGTTKEESFSNLA